MRFVRWLRLINWMPFRGVHVLELEPKVYALTAEWEHDELRSNWGGKSSVVWAVRFLLTGEHPREFEDGWITEGEKHGGVEVEFDDGTFASRLRDKGDATRLVYVYRDGSKEVEAHGEEAQRALDRLRGLDKLDDETTWWFGQKAADRFVTMEPGERTKIVDGWLELEPLRRAARIVAEELGGLISAEEANALRAAELERQIAEFEGGAERCRQRIAELEPKVGRLRESVERQRAWGQEQLRRQNLKRDAEEYVHLERELEEARKAGKLQVPKAFDRTEELQAAFERESVARRDLEQKRRLLRGSFDGTCPVGGVRCPITDELNAPQQRNEELYRQAKAEHEETAEELHKVELVKLQIDLLARNVDCSNAAAEERVRGVERRMQKLEAAFRQYRAVAGEDDVPAQEDETDDLVRANVELDKERAKLARLGILERSLEDVAKAREEARPKLTARREALAVFVAARRLIAKQALDEVEGRANQSLAEAGIDLRLELSWSRPTGQLAAACDGCGTPYPKTRTARECSVCGAARGPKMDERLRITTTDQSGGSEDLAGVFVQLAAGTWLRARRGSGWALACLDEPFAHLDRANKRDFAGHLAGMLRRSYGFEQAFIVAHDQGFLDGLPGRLKVTRGPGGSRVSVER